jgi:hypothetical protein
MKLTFQERINLGAILPTEGSWITISTVRELQDVIRPSDEDLKEVDGVVSPDGMIRYNISKDKEKDFEVSDMQAKITKDALVKLEKAEKLQLALIPLYNKFVIKG